MAIKYYYPLRKPKIPRVFQNFKTLRGGHWFSREKFENLEGPSIEGLRMAIKYY